MSSIDDLNGTPCNSGAGILSVQYDAAAGGSVALTCAPTTTYELTVVPTGSGTITSDRGGINCGTTCSQHYGDGTVVQLTAAPASGWVFAGWSGACTGTSTCTVTLGADTTVGALFRARLTVTVEGSQYSTSYSCGAFNASTCYRDHYTGGTVTSVPAGMSCGHSGYGTVTCTADFDPGTEATLTASPYSNSRFGSWSGAASSCGTIPTCTLTMSQPQRVGAYFPKA